MQLYPQTKQIFKKKKVEKKILNLNLNVKKNDKNGVYLVKIGFIIFSRYKISPNSDSFF